MRVIPAVALVLSLSACADPLAGVDRLGDVDIVETGAAQAALPDAQEVNREGFFGTSAAQGDVPEGLPEPTTPARGGFLSGLLDRVASADPAAAVAADVAARQFDPSDEVEGVEVAALPNATRTDARARSGPDARDVVFGTAIPFGEIARVCDARGKPLGKQIEAQGRRGFTLYDSNPESLHKRTFYVTGFDDGCPRQFTAATVLFGTPSFYEQIRFGPAGEHLPFAATDKAYDAVKSSVCRARASKPCGRKIGTLDDNTAFLSAYEFNEHNNSWKEFLVHDGAVMAGAVKSFK